MRPRLSRSPHPASLLGLLLAVVLLWPGGAAAERKKGGERHALPKLESAQRIVFELVTGTGDDIKSATAQVTRLGEDTEVDLVDDGSERGDTPGDGIFVGVLSGEYAAMAQVDLVVTRGEGATQELWSGVVRTPDPHLAMVGWESVRIDDRLKAVRVPLTDAGHPSDIGDRMSLLAATGWAFVLVAWVGWVVRLWLLRRGPTA